MGVLENERDHGREGERERERKGKMYTPRELKR